MGWKGNLEKGSTSSLKKLPLPFLRLLAKVSKVTTYVTVHAVNTSHKGVNASCHQSPPSPQRHLIEHYCWFRNHHYRNLGTNHTMSINLPSGCREHQWSVTPTPTETPYKAVNTKKSVYMCNMYVYMHMYTHKWDHCVNVGELHHLIVCWVSYNDTNDSNINATKFIYTSQVHFT